MKRYAELVSVKLGKEGALDAEVLAIAEEIMPAVQTYKDGGMELELAVERALDDRANLNADLYALTMELKTRELGV